jgi:phospholipase C
MLALLTALTTALGPSVAPAFAASRQPWPKMPIKHIIILFNENVSFDHYFGTYPVALNPKGEPPFHAEPGTPTVNGLNNALLNFNPNLNPANGSAASNPFRLDRSQAVTSDQDHDYTAEQQAFDSGLWICSPPSPGATATRQWATSTATPRPHCGTTPSLSP